MSNGLIVSTNCLRTWGMNNKHIGSDLYDFLRDEYLSEIFRKSDALKKEEIKINNLNLYSTYIITLAGSDKPIEVKINHEI